MNTAPNSERAFSLIEVALALGVVSFSIVTIIGLLSVSMNTFHDSKIDTAIGNIQRQLRAEIVSIPFASLIDQSSTGFTASKLYYTYDGQLLPGVGNAYYQASMELANTTAPGLTPTATSSMRTLEVTLISPYGISGSVEKTNSFSIVIANQKGQLAGP